MSFPMAYKLAEERGLNPEELQAHNPEHEAEAYQALAEAIPQELADGWAFLSKLAPVVKAQGVPWDECLHCTVLGTGELAKRAGIHALSYRAEKRARILAQVRRLSLFDVPRALVGQVLGVWPFALFDTVTVLSPVPEVDAGWAFQRHQVRLGWSEAEGYPQPDAPEEAQAQLSGFLLAKHRHGLHFLEGKLKEGGAGQLLIPTQQVEKELWDDVLALTGTLTGRATLAAHLGRSIATYNCCAPIFGPQQEGGKGSGKGAENGKPTSSVTLAASHVLQLQLQSEELANC